MSGLLNIENDMNNLLRLDAPLTRGPPPRWQKKTTEINLTAQSNGSITSERNSGASFSNSLLNVSMPKTPTAGLNAANRSVNAKTPTSKTPKKTPGKSRPNTPGLSNCKTPNKTPGGGDRFIPNRSSSMYDLGHFLINQHNENAANPDAEPVSPTKKEYQQAMSDNLHGLDLQTTRILSYSNKAPAAPEGHLNNQRVLYCQSKTPGSTNKTARHIPQTPERILDAPEIRNDYYLNLVDWSATNLVAVALANSVFVWNATSGQINQIAELENVDDYFSSVGWIANETNCLALGSSTGEIQLWDVEKSKRLRIMSGHSTRVSSMSWNSHVLSSGSRAGHINNSDVRVAQHLINTISGHSQEVCGLKWSPDGRYLASGANDNLLHVWPAAGSTLAPEANPVYTFNQHQAAVKALAWCPWQPSILASGGGTVDRNIRIWNCNTGANLNNTDTKSQVCGLQWSSHYKELISGHGYAHNELILWKYPSMQRVAELTGHSDRILCMCLSPDGTTVLSAGGDETLRFWKCFPVDPTKKKKTEKSSTNKETLILRQSIR